MATEFIFACRHDVLVFEPSVFVMERDSVENDMSEHMQQVATIVSAYVAHNNLRAADLADLISSVSTSLDRLKNPPEAPVAVLEPPVSIKKSIGDDFIISFEDGKKYKTLKRHLSTRGLTPDEYRSKWGLPPTYPMVAPSYSEARSSLAKEAGLGSKTGQWAAAKSGASDGVKKGRGRPRKDAAE